MLISICEKRPVGIKIATCQLLELTLTFRTYANTDRATFAIRQIDARVGRYVAMNTHFAAVANFVFHSLKMLTSS